jgi:hypothetical protein
MINLGQIVGAVASVGSAVGGLLSSSKSGANTSKGTDALWWAQSETSNAVQRALASFQNAYHAARGDLRTAKSDLVNYLSPYTTAGEQGMNAMIPLLTGLSSQDMISGLPPGASSDLLNYLTQSQIYQFPLQEGLNALDRSAASKGMLLSGEQTKATQRYGQDFALSNALNPAMQNYQNYLRNIAGMGGMGLQAATTTGTGLAGLGESMANVAMKTGELKGHANLAQAGLQNALAGNIASSYTQQGLLNQAASNRWGNALGSLIGTGIGGAYDIFKSSPWGQIGSGNVAQQRSIWGAGVS